MCTISKSLTVAMIAAIAASLIGAAHASPSAGSRNTETDDVFTMRYTPFDLSDRNASSNFDRQLKRAAAKHCEIGQAPGVVRAVRHCERDITERVWAKLRGAGRPNQRSSKDHQSIAAPKTQ
ncbi:MAG: UrcA family protein [Pseudomonadota bacterium]